MRIKQRLEDFRVRELLRPDYVAAAGAWRVYRVTKRKLTTLAAAAELAREAGVAAGDVSLAGFKDRQGITTQHMAIRAGRDVAVAARDLKIDAIGFAERELSSRESEGNAFDIVVRGLDRADLAALRSNVALVRAEGLVDYFDEQRFGNLRHDQGWIALDLLHGRHELALRKLLATPSLADERRTRAFRSALARHWGDWGECREIAGRFGQHHSVFEHLKKNPEDFAGAFFHLASRLRLIHLYAYQSHLWNRAVAALVRARTAPAERVVVESEEGPLYHPLSRAKLADLGETFRLPGPRLEDVTHPEQRRALEELLARDKVAAQDFDIRGVSGFQLKGEDRALFVVPAHLRVRPAEPDPENPPCSLVKLRFELPRGAYATLVVGRLLARPFDESARERDGGRPHRGPPEGGHGERPGRRFERANERRGERELRGRERGDRGERVDRRRRERAEGEPGRRPPRPRGDERASPRAEPRSWRPRESGPRAPRGDERAHGRRDRGGDRERSERPFGGGDRFGPRGSGGGRGRRPGGGRPLR